jgi:diaminopimelate epimerase
VNAHRRGFSHRQAVVVLDGGELLITWREDGHVLMRGPAEKTFSGILPDIT